MFTIGTHVVSLRETDCFFQEKQIVRFFSEKVCAFGLILVPLRYET